MAKNLRFIEGNYGYNHEFVFPSGYNLSWVTGFQLRIFDDSGNALNITTNMSAAGNIVTWAVQNTQTDFNGDYQGVLKITGASRSEEYHFDVDAIPKKT